MPGPLRDEAGRGLTQTGGRTTAGSPRIGGTITRTASASESYCLARSLVITLESEWLISKVRSGASGQARPKKSPAELAFFRVRSSDLEQFLKLSAIEAPITPDFEGRQFATPDELVDGGPIYSQKGGHLCDCQHFVHGHFGSVAESG